MNLDIASKKYPNAIVTIDDEDFERVKGIRWFIMKVLGKGERGKPVKYFYAQAHDDGKSLLLHRFIMRAKRGLVVKPINGNGLDCRKSNLMVGTYSQANASRRKRRGKVQSKYYGVYFDPKSITKPWRATLQQGGKKIKKRFATEKEAALHYNKIAKQAHGEFAILNKVDG